MSDSLSVILWWLTIFIIGSIFLPVTFALFHKFADRGYIFTKVIGILLSSYLMWIAGSLKIAPFEKSVIIIILLGALLANLWFFKKISAKNLLTKLPLPLIIFEECLFFVALFFWSYVRANEPSIRGLEKFMDFGFVNSILRSNFFPPLDMWLTKSADFANGHYINYYYYGHYITAFLTKLSGIDSSVTYNLMMATLFAFTFTLSFSIGMNLYYLFLSFRAHSTGSVQAPSRNLSRMRDSDSNELRDPSTRPSDLVGMTKIVIVGLLTAFIVTLGGNLHTIYTFTSNYPLENPLPPWQLELGFYPERYWYPNATRFIPFTIHEFPIYSFVVADLHGHVSDIPMVMLTLALLLTLLTNQPHLNPLLKGEENKANPHTFQERVGVRSILSEFEDHTSIPLTHIILLGLLLGVMYMTNAWDGLIYMILAGLVFLYINFMKNSGSDLKGAKGLTLSALYKTFSASLFLFFFFLVANLPFSLNFKPFVSGIGVLCAPSFLLGKKIGPFLFEAGKCQKSDWWQLLFLWGFFYYNVIGYLLFVIIPQILNKFTGNKIHQNYRSSESENFSLRSKNKIKNLLGVWKLGFGNLNPVDIFVLLMILISTLLLIFPEFFYVKDIYPAHYRANTMFKLGYQAFMMLGLVSSFVVFRIANLSHHTSPNSLSLKERVRVRSFRVWKLGFGILFLLVGIYPYYAINSYYGSLRVYRGLDGLNWLATTYPNDYQGILWLRKNVNNQPTVVEAQGDSYTDYARVSANTGLPTIVGWPVHEWLWRGSYDEAGRRIPEVTAIYESPDINMTKQILKKYNVEYIFVGNLEREKYKNLDEKKLESLGKIVFESGKTKIYRTSP
ncbi:hypothetical protein HZB96_00395 [Candidatus Gottesmanbacteria bacterium]|nr:hypothetical protein [Candidatus Gottesmanbacteria bacterium]MBI5452100.1 hypothetical protein [Candidatus Gottesmanbacteria bacterium]